VDVTYPATDKHVAKQRTQQRVLLWESRELYESVTLPLVEAAPASRVAWVDNILEGRAEADRVMARGGGGGAGEDGWVLLPDMKWDHRRAAAALAELKKLEEGEEGAHSEEALAAAADRAKSAKDSFYAQLIFRDKSLKSLRDVDGETAPRVAAAVAAAFHFIKAEYGIPRSSLRAFFHYHPSYWRLHVHLVGPQAFPDDSAGRAHSVEDVLEAVTAQPGWWRERALGVRSSRGDELAEALIAAGGEQQ
jgi:m7GpppX diphosphatase